MQLRYFQNTGIALGILADHQWVLIVFVPIALILLGAFAIKGRVFPHKLQQYTLVAVIVSGFSNWVDRIAHGFVIDMCIIDIDDFILNFTGALVGFIICKHTPIRHLLKCRAY